MIGVYVHPPRFIQSFPFRSRGKIPSPVVSCERVPAAADGSNSAPVLELVPNCAQRSVLNVVSQMSNEFDGWIGANSFCCNHSTIGSSLSRRSCPPDPPRHQPSHPLIAMLCAVMAGGQLGLGSWVRHINKFVSDNTTFLGAKKVYISIPGSCLPAVDRDQIP